MTSSSVIRDKKVPSFNANLTKIQQKNSAPKIAEVVEPSLPVSNDSSSDLKCAVCMEIFLSKNKLFEHLKATNHTVYVDKSNAVKDDRGKKKGKK